MDIPNDSLDGFSYPDFVRDRRPTISEVVFVLEDAFSGMGLKVRPVVSGPLSWIWEDDEMRALGSPKFFILSQSAETGLEGYPTFTVRQAYSVNMDTWVTTSGLVLGPDAIGIARSIALSIVSHTGAYAGMRHVVGTIVENASFSTAGLAAAEHLLSMPPLDLSSEATPTETAPGKLVN